MKKIKKTTIILATLFLPFTVLAEKTGQSLVETDIHAVVTVLQDLLFALAAVFIVIAGYNFLMAKGDASKIEQAREQIVYALIAMAIGALAWGLAAWLGEKLGSPFPISLHKATQFFL